MSDEPGSRPWTPEQKAAFNRWGAARVKAFKEYMEDASARWRRFCASATDTDRAALRADVAWMIAEQEHDEPDPDCDCNDLIGHAQRLADQITFDPERYFTLVSESMEDYGFRITIDQWLNGHVPSAPDWLVTRTPEEPERRAAVLRARFARQVGFALLSQSSTTR